MTAAGRKRIALLIVSKGHSPGNARLDPMLDHVKGYTLMELMVVVVLLGILFSFTAPRFRDAVLTDSLKSATLRLTGTIINLRSNAIQTHVDHRLVFDLEKNEYWYESVDVTAEGSALAHEDTVAHLPHDVRIIDIWIKNHGKIMSGDATIKFTKKGYTQQSAIHMESEDGRVFTLVLSPFLQKVTVMENYIEFEEQ